AVPRASGPGHRLELGTCGPCPPCPSGRPAPLGGRPLRAHRLRGEGAQRVLRPPAHSPPLPKAGARRLMTDPELIAKKLGEIETDVQELRTLARPDEIRQDIRERRFVEHTLR